MTSSGQYAFDPAFSTVVQSAYARIGIRRAALTAEHLTDAGLEGNFLLSEWSNKQPLLWTEEIVSIPLVQATATYVLSKQVVMILDAYVETGSGTSIQSRILGPLSTVEYDSLSNKATQGPPSTYYFKRLITPEITMYPVPDGNGPYTLKTRTVRQVQDASLPSGTTLETPYRALDAFLAGLAHRLARIHAPQLEGVRKQDAMEAWETFSGNDTENVPFFITPMLGSYYR